jgi:hypothetical protein
MSLETGPYFISSVSFATGQPVSRPLGLGRGRDAIVVLPLGSPPPLVSYDVLMFPNAYWNCMIYAVDYRKGFRSHLYSQRWWDICKACRWLRRHTDRSRPSIPVDNHSGCSQSTAHWYGLIWVSTLPSRLSNMTRYCYYRRIIVPNAQPQQSWFIQSTEGNQAVEVPVRSLYVAILYSLTIWG